MTFKKINDQIVVKEVSVKNYLTKSKLPDSDYVINPYVGCLHACRYCYASFMSRFTNHTEKWGSFLDVKKATETIDVSKLINKKVFLSSVTDCYNPLEAKYRITRSILEELVGVDTILSISTKSSLITRDIDLLKQMKNVRVAISINTLDEEFKNDLDKASPIKERLKTLKVLHDAGIYTVLFMSPIFPYITDYQSIIAATKDCVSEYWFENLNLRGLYKSDILNYIKGKYPKYYPEYLKIYEEHNNEYWEQLANEIDYYCSNNKIKFKNYFYHDEIVKK